MSGAVRREESAALADPGGAQRNSAAVGDPVAFGLLVDDLRTQLAAATGTSLEELRPQAAASLAVLRLAGALIHPALLAAAEESAATDLEPLISGPVADLVRTASTAIPVTTLWGNVASVIESSARMIAADHPALADRVFSLATGTLQLPALSGAWTGRVGASFRRTSCCQVTGPDPDELRCGDCVRNAAPETTSAPSA